MMNRRLLLCVAAVSAAICSDLWAQKAKTTTTSASGYNDNDTHATNYGLGQHVAKNDDDFGTANPLYLTLSSPSLVTNAEGSDVSYLYGGNSSGYSWANATGTLKAKALATDTTGYARVVHNLDVEAEVTQAGTSLGWGFNVAVPTALHSVLQGGWIGFEITVPGPPGFVMDQSHYWEWDPIASSWKKYENNVYKGHVANANHSGPFLTVSGSFAVGDDIDMAVYTSLTIDADPVQSASGQYQAMVRVDL